MRGSLLSLCHRNLLDDQEDLYAMQAALCNRPASPDYMNTDPKQGTGTSNISYQRNGPKHDDFKERKSFLMPSGAWRYTKPVGLLTNSITGSASDPFTAKFVSTGRVITMGQTTHGNVTGEGIYVRLPCNLVVRVSNGYIADASGRIIEGNGTQPQIRIEPTLEDAQRGIDGVLERAFVELEKQNRRNH